MKILYFNVFEVVAVFKSCGEVWILRTKPPGIPKQPDFKLMSWRFPTISYIKIGSIQVNQRFINRCVSGSQDDLFGGFERNAG